MSYRFHMLGLAHVPTSKDVWSCAYTQKIVKLAAMLKGLGHTVLFYGTEKSEVACDEFIQVGTVEEREFVYGEYNWRKEFFKHDPKDSAHRMFNWRATRELLKREQDRDFLLCPMGNYHESIANATKKCLIVESGVGYTGVFAKYRVFESYAWMHYVYGLLSGRWMAQSEEYRKANEDPGANGHFFDSVIPNYWRPEDFHCGEKKDYYLYIGRLISRKGLQIAVEVTEKLGKRLVVAGQGDLCNVDGMDLRRPHVEHVGSVDPARRADLMAGAIATFCPTIYIGPFEGVHVESMFCGTPVITTDWGVFAETVENGVNGYRCRMFSDFLKAAEACRDLNPAAIRRHAIEKWSIAAIAPKYQAYFDQLQTLFGKGWYH